MHLSELDVNQFLDLLEGLNIFPDNNELLFELFATEFKLFYVRQAKTGNPI